MQNRIKDQLEQAQDEHGMDPERVEQVIRASLQQQGQPLEILMYMRPHERMDPAKRVATLRKAGVAYHLKSNEFAFFMHQIVAALAMVTPLLVERICPLEIEGPVPPPPSMAGEVEEDTLLMVNAQDMLQIILAFAFTMEGEKARTMWIDRLSQRFDVDWVLGHTHEEGEDHEPWQTQHWDA